MTMAVGSCYAFNLAFIFPFEFINVHVFFACSNVLAELVGRSWKDPGPAGLFFTCFMLIPHSGVS